MSDITDYPCSICHKYVLIDAIECSICALWVHRKCAKLTKVQLKQLRHEDKQWSCENCKELFPFNKLDDNEFIFTNSYLGLINVNISNAYRKFNSINSSLHHSGLNVKENYSDFFKDIDPDPYLLKGINIDAKHVTEDELVTWKSENKGLSVIHFNARSLKKS